MRKGLTLTYAGVAYLTGLLNIAYIVGFLADFGVPKAINTGTFNGDLVTAVTIDALLVLGFGLHHSLTARPWFKRWWTRFVPAHLERATYLYMTAVVTTVLVIAWQPVPVTLWHVENAWGAAGIIAAYLLVLSAMFAATFHFGHFGFFGLAQAWQRIRGEEPASPAFTARYLYALVRHPISLGWMVVPWLTPHMTVGQLVFAVSSAVYVLVATYFEEADLIGEFGERYRRYRATVPAFLPGMKLLRPRSSRNPGVARYLVLVAVALFIAAGVASLPARAVGYFGPIDGDWRPGPCGSSYASPGVVEYHMTSGGEVRRYFVYVPKGYTGDTPVPVVIDLHASGIEPATELQVTRMDEAAEARGFLVALPVAVTDFPRGGKTWNVPRNPDGVDDVRFVADMLSDIEHRFCIDTDRVFAAGFSGGARLASELACALPERIAAISAVGGLRHPVACASDGSLPVVAFHSIDDPINPYDAGTDAAPPYWRYGVEEALHRWLRTNGCSSTGVETRIDANTVHLAYRDCAGAPVSFYRLTGEGHTWPGSPFPFPDYLGRKVSTVDATILTLDFFRAVAEPSEPTVKARLAN